MNRERRKRAVILLFLLSALLFCACREKIEQEMWGTQIEGLDWGMTPEIVAQEVAFQGEARELSQGVIYQSLRDAYDIYGTKMEITLAFDDDFGLIYVIGKCPEEKIETLKTVLNERFGNYISKTQWSEGSQWDSPRVREQYTQEQLQAAYDALFGEGIIGESYIKGRLETPLVQYNLREAGERKGELLIDGSAAAQMKWLFKEDTDKKQI